MLLSFIVLLLRTTPVLSSTFVTKVVNQVPNISEDEDVVCYSTEIRNSIAGLKRLENCTVIEGYLRIILIASDDATVFRNVSLPKLRVITDYLLLYRVQYLKTLSNIFPNLSAIRGRRIFYNYAFVVYEMFSLEDLGLPSLMLIERGAVLVAKNPQLCYLDTIDWKRIMKADTERSFWKNKDVDDCILIYPHTITGCPMKEVSLSFAGQLVRTPLCWNSNTCQRVCPSACLGAACYEAEAGSMVDGQQSLVCCHSECIGGCSGPTDADCFACRRVKYNGQCQSKCPHGMLELSGSQCVSQSHCEQIQIKNVNESGWKVFVKNGVKLCLRNCPDGYMESRTNRKQCVQCSGPCARVCSGAIVDSIQAAQKLEGCVVLDGILEIQIRGGDIMDLEKYLGDIQEVSDYVRVSDAHALMNLNFLKSLRLIKGKRLYHKLYAFSLLRNQNLNEIWDLNLHPNLTIENGKLFFLDNPKLCQDIIHDFLTVIGQRQNSSDADITLAGNGDLAVCEIKHIALYIDFIGAHFAKVRWEDIALNDSRYHISWVVNYRAVPQDSNITFDIIKEVCARDEWKSLDVSPDTTDCMLLNLQPFTRYIVYVKAYMTKGVKHGALSLISNFTTKMAAPSVVRNLKSESLSSTELSLTWSPPDKPNGLITHYIIYWSMIKVDHAKYELRDYCKNDGFYKNYQRMQQKHGLHETVTSSMSTYAAYECCQCLQPQKKFDEKEFDDMENKFEIAIDHYLQDNLFFKDSVRHNEIGSDGVSMTYDLTQVDTVTVTTTTDAIRLIPSSSTEPVHSAEDTFSKETTVPSAALGRVNHSMIVLGNTSVVISGLRHFEEFFIEIIACQGNQENSSKAENLCSMPAIIVARTLADDFADNVDERNVSLSHISGTTWLYWSTPQNPNAIIVAFEIELSKVDIKDYKPDVFCITYLQYKKLKGMSISKVLSSGNWSFRIRSLSLAGNGSWTDFHYLSINHTQAKAGDIQYLLGLIALIPILLILLAFYAVKVKRSSFLYPEVISYNPEYVNRDDLYEIDDWEVERDQVTLMEALGQGSFGMVYHGLFLPSAENEREALHVAVKTVNETATLRDRIAFLQEASVMKAFDSYHVVKLLGIVSKGHPSLVIMELMTNGDLKTFLRQCRPDDPDNKGRRPPTLSQTMQMAAEIADGMTYLASKKFVHRDLAARNCMVSDEETVKIGDFGLTRDIYATEYYRKKSKGLLPVRWMAPESLKDGIFTTHSDIWSYGVVIWEMVTLATQPYQGLSNEEVLHFIINGGQMAIPEGCPEKLAKLMSKCWCSHSEKRPTFDDIIEYLLPELGSKFYKVSHYFTRTKDSRFQQNSDLKQVEQESKKEELEDSSTTPLNRSFALKSPTMMKPEPAFNGFCFDVQHVASGESAMKCQQ